jgi:glycosyltransferase 2 family protein
LLAWSLNFAVVALRVQRWQRLLAQSNIAYSFREAWNAYNAAAYVGLLTPGRIGDVLRVAYLAQDRNAPAARGLASIAVDRLLDLAVLGMFAGLGVLHLGSRTTVVQEAWVWVWVAFALAAVPVFLSLASSRHLVSVPGGATSEEVPRFVALSRWLLAKLGRVSNARSASDFFEAARVQLTRGGLSAVLLTIASFALVYVQALLLAQAMGLSLGLFDVIALNALSTLLGLIPVSVSGLGVREVLFASLLPALGYSSGAGVSYGLLVFAVMYLSMVAYGFVMWQLHPLGREPKRGHLG